MLLVILMMSNIVSIHAVYIHYCMQSLNNKMIMNYLTKQTQATSLALLSNANLHPEDTFKYTCASYGSGT